MDNELQNYIPNLLLNLLLSIWGDRQDWFLGVDMAIHYEPHKPHIVPDGFLAIGVPRNTGDRGRLSFVTWQEKNTIPILMLEQERLAKEKLASYLKAMGINPEDI